MFPIGSRSRRLRQQATRSSVAFSTGSKLCLGAPTMDDLGPEPAVDRIGQGFFVAVAGAVHQGPVSALGEALALSDGALPAAAGAVMDQPHPFPVRQSRSAFQRLLR